MAQGHYKVVELSDKIIDCALEVHKVLGSGFPEDIYLRALAKELFLQDLVFSRDYEMPIFYKEEHIGISHIDFWVESAIAVELKAVSKLEDIDIIQAMNYLEAYDLEVGLLLNFGARSLEIKRLVNTKYPVKSK